jgi:hypothetical protein
MFVSSFAAIRDSLQKESPHKHNTSHNGSVEVREAADPLTLGGFVLAIVVCEELKSGRGGDVRLARGRST